MSALNGGPGDPPLRSAASVCDQGTGMWVVIGALSLLQRRHASGRGGIVQASLLETAMMWNGQKTDQWLNEGREPERHRSGHPGFVPYEAFETADAPLLICCGNDRLFAKLAQTVGRPQWADDERTATNRARLANKDALLGELRDVLRQRPRAEWIAALQAAGVPHAPIHTLAEAVVHPQVQAVGIVREVPGDDLRLTALPLSIDGVRPAPQGPAPRLGEHNDIHTRRNA
jgi:formyl-CoA transferase